MRLPARSVRTVLAFSAVVLGMHATPRSVQAQATSGTSTASASSATTTPAAAQSAGPYALAIREGYVKLASGDVAGAQLAFQRATTADPTKAEGAYLLGVTMLRNDSRPAALDAFRRAVTLAVASNDGLNEGRARLALARALSPAAGGATEERTAAWAAVTEFTLTHPDILSPDIPQAEIAALDLVRDLDRAMEPVRSRIANREREAHRTSGHSHH